MKQYTITRIEGQPDWSTIPALQVDHHNWVEPVDISMTAQICYDDKGLYLHLRAWEQNIRAEHKGYSLERVQGEIQRLIVCKHPKSSVTDEFYAIVDNGGRVLDVQVEHAIYGIISAKLSIASRYDADEFVRAASNSSVSQLADLTGGVHSHTIVARDEETFQRITERLRELGILVE